MAGANGVHRPYLSLAIFGPDRLIEIVGLVDSGSDFTVLPLDVAVAIGLGPTDLVKKRCRQLQGAFDYWHIRGGLTATAESLGGKFVLQPSFVDGAATALWGRLDFLSAWDLWLSESDQSFGLSRRR